MNNNALHLKSPKNQKRRAALGRPAIKITGWLQLVCGRPTLALSSALVPQTLSCYRVVQFLSYFTNFLYYVFNEINGIISAMRREFNLPKLPRKIYISFELFSYIMGFSLQRYSQISRCVLHNASKSFEKILQDGSRSL